MKAKMNTETKINTKMTLGYVLELKRVAFRNLARHRVKTTLTVLAIAVSVATYIFVDGWLLGMQLDSQRNIVSYETGAAKAQQAAYIEKLDELPMYANFSGWETYAAALDAAGYDTAPRFVFAGTLYAEGGSAPVVFIGCDPEAEGRLLRWTDFIEDGEPIRNGMTRENGLPMPQIVLGAMTADKLGVSTNGVLNKPGDAFSPVRITTAVDLKDERGVVRHVYQVIDAVVAGIVNSPNPKNNNNVAWIPLDVLQDDNGLMLEGKVTELLVRAKGADDTRLPGKNERAEVIAAALEGMLGTALPPGMGIYGWQTYAADYEAAAKGDDISSRIMVAILFILSFLGIANTMLLAILERTKEIGMMRAQGMTDGDLALVYMLEAGMAGFFGALAGALIGCLCTIPMVEHGLDFTAITNQMSGNIGYRTTGIFRSTWNVPVIIGSAAVATLVSAGAAFFPIRRALKMSITDSLRFE
ncbi:MAG: FtsX-like permease family protein [Spirochaetaceae bacterium]|jgi:ABC-type lipoprotein release transport system permease subunit|nr:FtsX-like permease family protein [Spirochaetaceae bacterium]